MPKADPLFTFWSFLTYYQRASNAYGIHSPFVYQLYQNVIKESKKTNNPDFEKQRRNLQKDNQILSGLDLGTGVSKDQSVRQVAGKALGNPRFHCFLGLLADFLHARYVLETGTSLGISAAYLANNPQRNVRTIEGNGGILDFTKSWHRKHNIDNIQYHEGDLYELLPGILESTTPDFIFHDADHRSRSVDFLMSSVEPYLKRIKAIVIHDIYWSRDMYAAWQKIVGSHLYPITVDIFQAGLIFPQVEAEKQHFIVKF